MTDAERTFWNVVRDRRLEGFKFRRQATIAPYIVDFLCIDAKLVVEIDGGQHDEIVDAPRTAFLEARGLRVVRFWNHDVLNNLDGVLVVVLAALVGREKKKTLTQPSPAKAGEG